MEVMGQETNKAYGTIHYGEPHDQSQGTYSVSVANNFADSYHTYAVDWEPGKITWYVDGIKYHEESDWFSAKSGQGTVAYPDFVISTTKAGNADYSIQLVQPNVPLKKGGTYKVTFDAYADEARTMMADISGPDHNYTRYLSDTKLDLGTGKKNYSLEFQMTSDSDANGRLEFNLGNTASTATVYISNVRVAKTKDGEIKEDTTKKALADGNYVYNGSFQEGTGTVLVGQSDLALGAGSDYELSFTAQADEAKTMTVTVAGETYTFALTTEKKNYSKKIKTAAELQNKNISFDLGLGTTVYLDDVRIDEDALIKNGSFNAGFSGFEAYCYTPSNVTYVVDSLNESNAADFTIKDTGDQEWHIQLKQTGVNLEKGQ